MSNKKAVWPTGLLVLILAGLFLAALIYGDAAPAQAAESRAAEAAEAEPAEPETPEAEEAAAEAAAPTDMILRLRREGRFHGAYLTAYSDGTMRPDESFSRGWASWLLYWLLDEELPERAELKDVAEGDPWAESMTALAAYGVLRCPGGYARPEEPVTRGAFAYALSRFFEGTGETCPFTDVDAYHPYRDGIAKAAALGLMNGDGDGRFRPDAPMTRGEVAAVMNRALGRTADRETADSEFLIPLYRDLPAGHWAYYELLEASVDHTQAEGEGEHWTQLRGSAAQYEEGPVLVGTDLYYVGAEGRAVTDATVGTLYFGPDGRYTSGDAEIDGYVREVLTELVTPGADREEILHAAYNWTRDSFTYLKRHYYEIGDEGWTLEEGRVMFETGKGNCYCYTSVFYYLSRALGYDATAVSGVVGSRRSPHGWVEIEFDGESLIFDTELEMSYRKKGNYSYDFYAMSYSRTPWAYVK